jgi:dynein heavy chain 1, cytosolic
MVVSVISVEYSELSFNSWVMLKNVHLAPVWLVQLEKKLHSLQPHPNFRLFLTTEISPKLPVNLLRAGRVLVFEPPPGIRANLLRTFATVLFPLAATFFK